MELYNITKRINERLILNDVSLSFADPGKYLITGEAGSGKSTLLRIMTGVIRPDFGVAVADDRPVFNNPDIKKTIFFITAREYLYSPRSIRGMHSFFREVYEKGDTDILARACDKLGLDPAQRIGRLDKAQKMKAALALGLSVMPKYIIIDDVDMMGEDDTVYSVIDDAAGEGMTIICSVSIPNAADDSASASGSDSDNTCLVDRYDRIYSLPSEGRYGKA